VSSILLADDNPHAQRMGSQILSQEGHTVITVSDGDEAMRHLELNVPDLVMVDTRMPGPSGFEICKYIKSQPKFGAVKVVLLAGPLEPFDTAEAESAGPDGVLHKPLDAYTLIDTVNSLLGQVPETADQSPAAGANRAKATPADGEGLSANSGAENKSKAEPPRFSAAPRPQPAQRPAAAPLQTQSRDTATAATATAATATVATATGPSGPVAAGPVAAGSGGAGPGGAATAVASRPATAVADFSDALSDHFTSVVEQALGTEDAQQRQRQHVESIVREVLEAALPALIEQITDRVMASLER
jgi:twitching motility two-component system response regulator PilH